MSGTFTSTIASYLFLDLSWSVLSQDIVNNRSRVRLELKLRHTGTGLYFSASKSGVLQGSSFTYTGGFSGSGTRTLQTRDIWINHDSDGSKKQNVSGSFNIAITYSGAYRGNTSVSGDITLPTIPRASSLTSFSIGSALKPSTANTVRLAISRASGSFTHDIQLRDGTSVIASWNGQGLPTSLNLSTSQVNTLLDRMSNVTSKSLTLRVQTKNGSTNIGSAVSRNATATVDSSVTPNINSTSASILGQGGSRYVQTISGLRAEFTSSATGGATVSSRSITFDGVTGGSVVGSVFRRDFNRVNNAGTRTITYRVTDSRGRTTTATRTIAVVAYNPPEITQFSATRNSSTPTTVNITRAGQHSNLSGSNTLVISIQKRQGSGSWVDVVTPINHTGGPFSSTTITSTGNNVALSYEFKLSLTDSFGNRAESIVSVPTQRVVLDVHKNEGVGIGKIHEKGTLDVDGEAYFNGDLYVNGVSTTRTTRIENVVPTSSMADTVAFWTSLPQGVYFVRPDSIPNQPSSWGILHHMSMSGEFNSVWYGQPNGAIYRKSGNHNSNNAWSLFDRPDRGSNSNGDWVRFEDGTQICWARRTMTYTRAEYIDTTWNYPVSFNSAPILLATGDAAWIGRKYFHGNVQTNTTNGNAGSIRMWYPQGLSYVSGDSHPVTMIAIGRWK